MYEILAALQTAETAQPEQNIVMTVLASYGGLSLGVGTLIAGLKGLFKKLKGHEHVLTVFLTFLLGIVGKIATDVYGPPNLQSWALHLVTLLFVAAGAGVLHDKVANPLQGKPDPSGGKK